MATCNLFRNPSLLAKMSSTLDVISGGRLEFGIGAGWFKEEAEAYGINFPKFSERVERLRESINIIKLMWTEERSTFQGKYYSIKEAINNPKPIQKPRPPIWVGGKGEKYMLPLIAEVADWTNLNWVSPKECKDKIKILEANCTLTGRKPEEINNSLQNFVIINDNQHKLDLIMEKIAKVRGLPVEEFINKSKPIYGTPERCSEIINQYIDAGISYFILIFLGAKDTSIIELFSDKIIHSFR
jgi:alkanesulfonate monooxygenase SsuD/methylene tetrahydromethanopterin reductase-like flavin-dependent oxidoreductase (luciferase family)